MIEITTVIVTLLIFFVVQLLIISHCDNKINFDISCIKDEIARLKYENEKAIKKIEDLVVEIEKLEDDGK